MKHNYYDNEYGLAHCKVCNGAEGSLPTECPGKKMTYDEEMSVYEGVIDYINGNWVGESPAK